MKIEFEGSIAEFRELFKGVFQNTAMSPTELYEATVQGARDVVKPMPSSQSFEGPRNECLTCGGTGKTTRITGTETARISCSVCGGAGFLVQSPPNSPGPVEVGQAKREEMPEPPEQRIHSSKLPRLTPEMRRDSWRAFVRFCSSWVVGFEETQDSEDGEGNPTTIPAPQPDRVELIKELGEGRHTVPVLVMAYEIESLQRLVEKALAESNVTAKSMGLSDTPPETKEDESQKYETEWKDWLGRICSQMSAVSHMGFADLAGTYDHTEKWMRRAA